MKLYETLIAQLKCENDFVSDNGEVKKWVVADKARNYDSKLLALLLANDDLRNAFFKDVNSTTIFLLDKFLLFIEQKNYLNDSYTAYRNKIGLTIGGRFLNQRNEVELVWPYKDCILEGGQTKEDQKRPEIFFNETLARDEITQLLDPKVLTGYKRYGTFADDALFHRDAELNAKRGLPANTITDNLIIKGNNLLALHSLKKEFAGKVKLIYIDPPYNTGNDSFGYNDSFNHSTWLTFMKNRLEVAKTLLKDDGAIFVQCDDNEQAYLKILMDEVFKEENFVNEITVKTSESSGVKMSHIDKKLPKIKEYILVYKKQNIKINPIKISKAQEKGKLEEYLKYYRKIIENIEDSVENWRIIPIVDYLKNNEMSYDEESIRKFQIENAERMVYRTNNKSFDKLNISTKLARVTSKQGNEYIWWEGKQMLFLSDYIDEYLCDLWTDISTINLNKEGNVDMPNGKKPETIIERVLNLLTDSNDIILDFFGGSGTTAAVAHKMNRQYITCEQIDNQINLITKRLQNVVDGDLSGISKSDGWEPQNPTSEDSASGRYNRNNFIYLELKKFNQAFIERIEAAKDTETLLQIWEQMKEKSFLAYNVDLKAQEENMEEFKQLDFAQQKEVLCELLDKNQLYVNVSDMNDNRFETTDEDRAVTEAFYSKK